MRFTSIPLKGVGEGGGGKRILLVASFYRDRDKLRPDRPFGSYADFLLFGQAWHCLTACLFVLFFRSELSFLRKIYNILSTFASLQHTYDSVICLIAFITLIFTGIRLTPFNVFTMVGLLSENRRSLVYGLTDGMQLIADCFASLERIESFLLIEELNGKELTQQDDTAGNENGDEKEKEKKVIVERPSLKVQYSYIIRLK